EMQIGDTITADTTGMTNPFIDGCVVGAPMQGPTLWYYVIGDGNTLTASLCNEGTADWDHVLSVFCGNCSSIMNSNMYCAGGNDVACQVPGENIWAPEVEWCTEEGVQYWIAVYGPGETQGNYGVFALSVTTDGTPCGNPVDCACELFCDGAQLEQEPCGEDTNGGCNFDPNDPHSYEEVIECGVPLCGTAWADTSTRDTDWYLLDVPDLGGGGAEVVITFASQFFGLLGVLPDDCDVNEFTDFVTSDLCEEVTLTTWMWAGNNIVWAGPADWYNLPCGLGNEYKFTVTCQQGEPPVICEYEEEPFCKLFWQGITGISSTSSDESGYTVTDDFTFLADTQVNHLCWWGLNGTWDGTWNAGPCNTLFRITFYNDDGNSCPSTVYAGPFNVESSCEDTGVFYNDPIGNVYEFTAFLPQTVTFMENECYWVEIVDRSVGDSDYFLWTGSEEGNNSANNYSMQDANGTGYECPTEYIDVNRSLCMGLGDPPAGQAHGDAVICAGEVPFDGCQDYSGGTAANSDAQGGFHVADDFRFLVSTTVDELRWWGVDYYNDGTQWLPCYEHNTEFHITYYVDGNDDGCPDDIVAQFDVSDAGVDSGYTFNDATVWEYTAIHDDVVFTGNQCYWVEIVGDNGDGCWFMWLSSNDFHGNDLSLQAQWGVDFVCPDNYTDPGYDLSFCMANNGADVTLDSPANCVQP
ncbi:MAG: hypothetical protein JSV91_13580, partial [Phycisphaerales bacterium]